MEYAERRFKIFKQALTLIYKVCTHSARCIHLFMFYAHSSAITVSCLNITALIASLVVACVWPSRTPPICSPWRSCLPRLLLSHNLLAQVPCQTAGQLICLRFQVSNALLTCTAQEILTAQILARRTRRFMMLSYSRDPLAAMRRGWSSSVATPVVPSSESLLRCLRG